MRKVLKIFSNLLLAVLLSAAALFALPRLFGIQIYGVLTGSMEPAYSVGDLLYVVPTDADEIEVGDVISFLMDDNGTVATHRVVEIDEESNYFYTKGDANEIEDGTPVHFNNVIGVVRLGIPVLGYAAIYMSTSSGKIITITAVVASIIMVVLFDLLSRADAEELAMTKEEKEELVRLLFRYDPEKGFVRTRERIIS